MFQDGVVSKMESRVREGERSFRKRNPYERTMVQIKNRRNYHRPPTATRTCFIDCLPRNVSIQDLEKLFHPYRLITNIFIPQKKD